MCSMLRDASSPPLGELLPALRDQVQNVSVDVDLIGNHGFRITLRRPEKRNAISMEMAASLTEILKIMATADQARLVVFASEGDFCGGVDLNDRGSKNPRDNIERMGALFAAIAALPQYSVALVSGGALGAGTGVVAACDGAVASADARFGTPEVRLGLIPSVISPYIIAAVGRRQAVSLFATATTIDAAKANAIGLVTTLVPDHAALKAEEARLADLMMLTAPQAVREAKRLLEFDRRSIDEALVSETVDRTMERMASVEVREGFVAFREKRSPKWTRVI